MNLNFVTTWFVPKQRTEVNVFIGGVGSVFTSAAILANKLVGVVPADILDFQIDSDENVTFRTDKAYGLQPGDFLDPADRDKLKFFIDRQGFFNKGIGNDNLRSSTGLKFLDLPNCGVEASSFVRIDFLSGANQLPFVIIPKVTAFSFEDVSPRYSVIILNSMFDGNTTDLGYLRIKREADNNSNQEIVYRTNETKPNRIAVSSFNEDAKGATYFDVSWDLPAPAAPTNNALRWSEVWFNGVWMQIDEATNFLGYPLRPNTDYNLKLYARDNMANRADALQVNVKTNPINPLLQNAVSYWYLIEQGGGDIYDSVSGLIEGNVTAGTEQTRFGIITDQLTEYGVIDYDPKFDLYQNGANQDFTIALDVMILTNNPDSNLEFFIAKGSTSNFVDRDFQFLYRELDEEIQFTIFSQNGQFLAVRGAATLNLGTEYRPLVTHRNGVISIALNGAVVASEPVPSGFDFNTSSSDIILGAAEFSSPATVFGKIRNVPYIVGEGFTTAQIAQYGTPNTELL